ncbi:MAG: sigma-70 family RNA polymerase sigma factor [Chloroflexi bacterium]|nr:sigma-70 family RNA polymerase sigma factor [Chloroflexota bacterium]
MQVGADGQTAIEQLVKEAQKGDPAALAALYERFFDQIYRYVSFKSGSRAEAEDITGDVFVKMLESIHSFKWQGHPFSSWLFRIARNLIVDYFRRAARKKTVPLEVAAATVGTTPDDMSRVVETNLTMADVRVAMQGLTSLQQEVISLRFAGGLSVSETAGALGKNDNAVKALQHVGLKKLRTMLAQQPLQRVATGRGEV